MLEYIKEFEGIIGALGGVIVTTLINEYLKSKGKIKLYYDGLEKKFLKQGSYGEIIESDSEIGAERFNYSFNIQLYNPSDVKRILRDIKIQFKGSNWLGTFIPYDGSIRKSVSYGSTIQPLKIINLNPKEIIEVKIDGSIRKEKFNGLTQESQVYFMAKIDNGKKIKQLIKMDE